MMTDVSFLGDVPYCPINKVMSCCCVTRLILKNTPTDTPLGYSVMHCNAPFWQLIIVKKEVPCKWRQLYQDSNHGVTLPCEMCVI